jgi:hypothetical protein
MVWSNADKRVDFLKRKKLKAERPRIITVFRLSCHSGGKIFLDFCPTDTLYAKENGYTQAIAFNFQGEIGRKASAEIRYNRILAEIFTALPIYQPVLEQRCGLPQIKKVESRKASKYQGFSAFLSFPEERFSSIFVKLTPYR